MTSPINAYSDHHGLRRYNVEGMDPHPISVTTLIKGIAPPKPLVTWMDKRLVGAALEAYVKTGDEELSFLAGKNARWTDSEEADLGTSVHALTEQVDMKKMGKIHTITPVPNQKKASGFTSQWEKARDAFQMEILAVECTFVNRELGYAGTADRVVIIPALSQNPIVLDIKSGKNIYPDVALQCAALANCDQLLHDDGTMIPIPWELDKTVGVAAHVRPRSAKFIPLDLESAWEIFKPLPQLALWRADQIEVLGDPLEPDEIEQRRADLRFRIAKLPSDLRSVVKSLISMDADISGGSTLTWNEEQLLHVEEIFVAFEHEARERVQHVLGHWAAGDLELQVKVLEFTEGKTNSIADMTASEADQFIKLLTDG